MRLSAFLLGLAALLPGAAGAQPRRAPPPAAPAQQPQAAPAPTGTAIPLRLTAKALTGLCNDNQIACLTYVLGAIDAYFGTSVVTFGRTYICIPPQVTNQQVANVAIAFLRAHPEMQDQNAALIVVQGVSSSFPCR